MFTAKSFSEQNDELLLLQLGKAVFEENEPLA